MCNNLCICPRYLHKKVWTNPLSGYVYIIYIYQWMSVQFFLHIFNKKFWLQLCYFCILMYNIPTRIFTDLYSKSKRQHFRVFVYKSNLYFFFIWNCRISNSRTICTIIQREVTISLGHSSFYTVSQFHHLILSL
jgi:hypothetical protein